MSIPAMESLGTVFALGFMSPEQYAALLLEGSVNLDSVSSDGVERIAASIPGDAQGAVLDGIATVLTTRLSDA